MGTAALKMDFEQSETFGDFLNFYQRKVVPFLGNCFDTTAVGKFGTQMTTFGSAWGIDR